MYYGWICLSVWWGVYCAPGIVLCPQLLKNPVTAVVVPLLSVGMITLIMMPLLQVFHLWSSLNVQILTGTFSVLALWRLYNNRSIISQWQPAHWRLLWFNAWLLLPYFVKAGLAGFDTDDEIYSWNFWALQHLFQEPISFVHTGAPYPQLFPKLIAYQYQLLNNIELQLPIKALLVLFSFCTLNIIAFAGKVGTAGYQTGYIFLCLGLVFGLNWQQYFDYGYADMPMVAFLMASVALWVHAKSPVWIVLSVFLAFCAAMTKQAALIWAALALPCLLLWTMWQTGQRYRGLLAVVLGCLLALWWGLEGQGVTDNTGVIGASTEGRAWAAQLWFSVKKYWIFMPHLFLLYVLAAYGCIRAHVGLIPVPLRFSGVLSSPNSQSSCTEPYSPVARGLTPTRKPDGYGYSLWCLFIIPGTLGWFLFGAYHLRLGIHLIAVLGFLVLYHLPWFSFLPPLPFTGEGTASSPLPFTGEGTTSSPLPFTGEGTTSSPLPFTGEGRVRVIWIFWIILSFLGCFWSYQRSLVAQYSELNVYQASSISLRKYFGLDSDWILKNLLDRKDLTLFVPASYIHGLFYGHNHLVRPDYDRFQPYDRAALLADWAEKKPDFVITSGRLLQGDPASALTESLAQEFPELLKCVADAPNRYGYKIYAIIKERNS